MAFRYGTEHSLAGCRRRYAHVSKALSPSQAYLGFLTTIAAGTAIHPPHDSRPRLRHDVSCCSNLFRWRTLPRRTDGSPSQRISLFRCAFPLFFCSQWRLTAFLGSFRRGTALLLKQPPRAPNTHKDFLSEGFPLPQFPGTSYPFRPLPLSKTKTASAPASFPHNPLPLNNAPC